MSPFGSFICNFYNENKNRAKSFKGNMKLSNEKSGDVKETINNEFIFKYHLPNIVKNHKRIFKYIVLVLSMRNKAAEIENESQRTFFTKSYQKWMDNVENTIVQDSYRMKEAKFRTFFEREFPELKKKNDSSKSVGYLRSSKMSNSMLSQECLHENVEVVDELNSRINYNSMDSFRVKNIQISFPISSNQFHSKYLNNNGFISNKNCLNITSIDTWREEDVENFKKYFSIYPKNFERIAYSIRKDVQSCIEFYYKYKHKFNIKMPSNLTSRNFRKKRMKHNNEDFVNATPDSYGFTSKVIDRNSNEHLNNENIACLPNYNKDENDLKEKIMEDCVSDYSCDGIEIEHDNENFHIIDKSTLIMEDITLNMTNNEFKKNDKVNQIQKTKKHTSKIFRPWLMDCD